MNDKKHTILVVDDNPNNLRVLCDLLEKQGYRTRPEISGQGALDNVSKINPDLILLDIRMPDIDGYQVCENLKRNNKVSDIPVIFISAASEMSDIMRGFDVGGVDYITKPFEAKIVLLRVKNHLNLYATKRELIEANSALKDVQENLEETVSRKTWALSQSQKRLRELSCHIQRVREEEKRNIAKEVHDELGATLTALNFDIHWLQCGLTDAPSDIRDKVDDMSDLVKKAADSCRRIVTELRPSILDDLGLVAALDWQADDFAKRNEIPCKFTSNVDEIDIASDQAIVIFRIFQEALTNIVKHAKACNVDVIFLKTDRGVSLQVVDDGVGISNSLQLSVGDNDNLVSFDSKRESSIDPTIMIGTYGIRGMFERALSVGGTLNVESYSGSAGTRVVLFIPLEREAVRNV